MLILLAVVLDVTSAAVVVADLSDNRVRPAADTVDDTVFDELMWNDLEILSNLFSS